METLKVECEYCHITADIALMEHRKGRGFVCRDAAGCMAREDAQAAEEWADEARAYGDDPDA